MVKSPSLGIHFDMLGVWLTVEVGVWLGGPVVWLGGPIVWLGWPVVWLGWPVVWLGGLEIWLDGHGIWLDGHEIWLGGHEIWLGGGGRHAMSGVAVDSAVLLSGKTFARSHLAFLSPVTFESK